MTKPPEDAPEVNQPSREELQRRLDLMEQTLFNETRKLTSVWRVGVGKFSTRSVVGSGQLSLLYLILAGCCLTVGIVLTLHGTVAQNVGVALIVGSIFSIASFAGQAWTVIVQQERAVTERIQGVDSRVAKLQIMYEEIIRLSDRIKDLPPDA